MLTKREIYMEQKQHSKKIKSWVLLIVVVFALSSCGEGCEDCEEPLPTEILSFTYTPNPVFVGDTVTFKVQIKDSLETGFEYYWSARAYSQNVGKILDGTKDSSKPGLDYGLDWYRTTVPKNRWVASADARIAIVIFNSRRSNRQSSTSQSIMLNNK